MAPRSINLHSRGRRSLDLGDGNDKSDSPYALTRDELIDAALRNEARCNRLQSEIEQRTRDVLQHERATATLERTLRETTDEFRFAGRHFVEERILDWVECLLEVLTFTDNQPRIRMGGIILGEVSRCIHKRAFECTPIRDELGIVVFVAARVACAVPRQNESLFQYHAYGRSQFEEIENEGHKDVHRRMLADAVVRLRFPDSQLKPADFQDAVGDNESFDYAGYLTHIQG